jgi:thermolysin
VEIESTTPDIKQERAIEVARMHLSAILSARPNDPELEKLRKSPDQARTQATLVIYEPALMRAKGSKQDPARLAWLITIDAFRFFVDAKVADVLFYYLDQRKASQQRVFDLQKRSNFPGTKVLDDIAGKRIKPLPRDAEDAHTNAGLVVDYFANVFGRAGLLDRGADETLSSYVRFGNSKNAYWCINKTYNCPQAGAMVYGEGYPAALDIVGHEMTHGMITVEADLTYANESGAVNESLADIFGTLIEFATNPGTANWVLGDKLQDKSHTKPLRSISNPNLSDGDGHALFDRSKVYDGQNNRGQPDHYADYVTREDPICETTRDYWYGCVHFNSGIFNKFAFLVAEGGRHRGSVVLGIGREKLGRVAYRALVTHLNPSTGLRGAAEAFLTACSELADARVAGFVSADCDRIRKAQDAVGLTIAGS